MNVTNPEVNLPRIGEMRRSAEQAVTLLKTLANESRLLIMCVLSEGEHSVGAPTRAS